MKTYIEHLKHEIRIDRELRETYISYINNFDLAIKADNNCPIKFLVLNREIIDLSLYGWRFNGIQYYRFL